MQHDTPAVMIFAAGFGTRMKHLTRTQPKPLIPVAGRPLIDHAIEMANATCPPRMVANLHYLPEQIEAHLEGGSVITLREDPDILETGGGLRHAMPYLQTDPVITVNPDAVWAGPNPLNALLKAWDSARMDALLMCIPQAQTHGRIGDGDFSIGADGQLHRGGGMVYGGVQIMKTNRLHEVSDRAFSLNVVWNLMAQDRRLFGISYTGHWCDVGHPEGIGIAEDILRRFHV